MPFNDIFPKRMTAKKYFEPSIHNLMSAQIKLQPYVGVGRQLIGLS